MSKERSNRMASKLKNLIEEIYPNFGEEIEQEFENRLVTIKKVDLDYDPDQQSKDISINYDQEEREVLTDRTIDRVLEFVQSKELYSDIIVELNNLVDGSESYLNNFLSQVVQKNPNEFDDNFVTDSITSFVKELAGGNYEWNSEIWLRAIYFEPDQIKIDDELTLRKPTEEDLEGTSKGRSLRHISRVPSLILDIKTITDSHRDISQKAEEITSVLRLFDLGSVEIIRMDFNPQTLLKTLAKGIFHPGNNNITPFKFTVNDSQKENLNQFINVLLPIVKQVKNQDLEPNLEIALDRYEKAITEKRRMESILTSGFMVLEALFVRDKERGELTYRLTKRVGKFLGIFSLEPIEVRRKLNEFYDIRSSYLHGGEFEDKNLRQKTEYVMNYARIALVAFLLLNQEGYNKGDIISKIENAFLKIEAYEKFKEEVQGIVGDLIS